MRWCKLKPNSSGQNFKLYRGIIGFSNVLFWVFWKEKSMVFTIRALCAIWAIGIHSSNRWIPLISPSKTLKTKHLRIQLYHSIVWKIDQKNWASHWIGPLSNFQDKRVYPNNMREGESNSILGLTALNVHNPMLPWC